MGILALLVIMIYSAFIIPMVTASFRFSSGGEDSLEQSLAITKEWMEEFGSSIDEEEYQQLTHRYHQMIGSFDEVIRSEEIFEDCDIHDYEGFLAYQNEIINDNPQYSAESYAEMQELLSASIPYSAMYMQEYQNLLSQYVKWNKNGASILPVEFLSCVGQIFQYAGIGCLIAALFSCGWVMVRDCASRVNLIQYCSKIGRKNYWNQYLCAIISAVSLEGVIFLCSIPLFIKIGVSDFNDCGIDSFMNWVKPVAVMSFQKWCWLYVGCILLFTLGIGSFIFLISSCTSNIITFILKVIPLLVIAGLYLNFLNGFLMESNLFYGLLPASGIEIWIAVGVCLVGVLSNIIHYFMGIKIVEC